MSITNYQKVAEFNVVFDCPQFYHTKFDRENWIKPEIEKVLKYRCDLIKEEGVEEFGEALKENNRVEMIDAICDSLYVLYGAAWTMEIDVDYHFKQIFDHDKTNFTTIKNIYLMENNLNEKTMYTKLNEKTMYTKLNELYIKFINFESEFRKVMLSGNGEFDKVVTLLIMMIVTTYRMGIILKFDVDEAFNLVHESNMSKLCKTEEEAQQTVDVYTKDYKNGKSPYDSPYYYKKEKYYVVKNQSTGKVLKSINYTPVNLQMF
jgi:predicted HAD superfamily Cof-like phosphohydrolase